MKMLSACVHLKGLFYCCIILPMNCFFVSLKTKVEVRAGECKPLVAMVQDNKDAGMCGHVLFLFRVPKPKHVLSYQSMKIIFAFMPKRLCMDFFPILIAMYC